MWDLITQFVISITCYFTEYGLQYMLDKIEIFETILRVITFPMTSYIYELFHFRCAQVPLYYMFIAATAVQGVLFRMPAHTIHSVCMSIFLQTKHNVNSKTPLCSFNVILY